MKKNILLIIDAQNDFVEPSGTLYVPGAIQDMTNIVNLIKEKGKDFDEILVSLDLHQHFDIGHPCFWVNSKNEHPEPFSIITLQDVENKTWMCTSKHLENDVQIYFKSLEIRKTVHTIWPEHCIIGTVGSNLFEPIQTELEAWSKKYNRTINYINKGLFPLSEFHGLLGPAVEFPSYGEEASFNYDLQQFILSHDNIIITGEAKSHCVGETIEQLLNQVNEEEVCKKITILEDCMSNIVNFEHGIYKTIRDLGATFTLSNTVKC